MFFAKPSQVTLLSLALNKYTMRTVRDKLSRLRSGAEVNHFPVVRYHRDNLKCPLCVRTDGGFTLSHLNIFSRQEIATIKRNVMMWQLAPWVGKNIGAKQETQLPIARSSLEQKRCSKGTKCGRTAPLCEDTESEIKKKPHKTLKAKRLLACRS